MEQLMRMPPACRALRELPCVSPARYSVMIMSTPSQHNSNGFVEEEEEDEDADHSKSAIASKRPTNSPLTPLPPSNLSSTPPSPQPIKNLSSSTPNTTLGNQVKRQKISFGFSLSTPSATPLLQTGNALQRAARAAKPTQLPKMEMPKPAQAKASGIESLKKELEGSMRHRPNPASRTTRHSDSKSERYSETSSRTLSSEFEAKQHAKSSNADSTSKSGNDDEILRQPIETTQESKPRKAQKEAKNIDDMLRQILPSHLMKDLSGKNKDRMENKDKSDDKSEDKSELTVHSIFGDPEDPEKEIAELEKEIAENETSNSGSDDKMMPEMKGFMKKVYLRAYARERKFDGLVGIVDVKGDIFNSDCDVFIHCCNCFHKMSAGIAKEMKRVFPEVYQKDLETPLGDKQKLGHFTSVLTLAGITVVNLYAQFSYGTQMRHLDYEALELGLTRLVARFRDQKVYPKIGTYYMGCFNAGGDIEVVKLIFSSVFTDRAVYVFDQDQQ